MMYPHMYETIIWRRKDITLDPALSLAEKWEQVDPTTLRLTLRQGVTFHNGDGFDAEAVKVSAESYTAPESKFPVKSSLAVTREVKIVDKHTVEYLTSVPSRPLLRIMSLQAMLSPRALRELGPKIATNPVGTGPYKFVEYVPGQHVLMETNPQYWGPKPRAHRLKIRFIPENGTRLAALESGEVMMITNVPPDSIKRLESNPQLAMRTSVTNRIMFVTLRTDRPPWTDKRARQALNYAIDKEAITQGLLGGRPLRGRRCPRRYLARIPACNRMPMIRPRPNACWPKRVPAVPRSTWACPTAAICSTSRSARPLRAFSAMWA
jgi:peptide/nickel transport system substrate-binding protein